MQKRTQKCIPSLGNISITVTAVDMLGLQRPTLRMSLFLCLKKPMQSLDADLARVGRDGDKYLFAPNWA